VWDALHGAENYAYLPAAARQQFLRRTAARLHRCGWLIVDGRYADGGPGYASRLDWLTDYRAVYTVTEERSVGSVVALHLRPQGQTTCTAQVPP